MSNFDANESLRELCAMGDLELLKKFIEQHKPDINSQNKMNGWTALHWACKRNFPTIVEFLINNGASNEITNKDGKKPSFYTSNAEIKQFLKDESEAQISKSTFVPNYLQNPEFFYSNTDRFMLKEDAPTEVVDKPKDNSLQSTEKPNTNIEQKNVISEVTLNKSSMITVRVRLITDSDFIEFDFDKSSTSFEDFKELCVRELELERNKAIKTIRKLPNILIRNSKDIQRLKNEQEIEICF